MIWVPVAAIGFLLLVGPCILAIAAWVRAQDAQERLKLYELRIAELEARAGVVRPRPAALRSRSGAAAAPGGDGDGSALEERIALVWFSRIGVAVMLLGAAWFLFSPGDTAFGRAIQLAVGAVAGAAALGLAEVGRGRTRGAYHQVFLAMGVALLLAVAFASRAYGVAGAGAAQAAVAAGALLGAAVAFRHRAEPPLVLALLGVLAAPLFLGGGRPHLGAFAWVTLLGGAGALLAARLAFAWAIAAALLGTGALFAAWAARAFAGGGDERVAALAASAALLAIWLVAQRLARDSAKGRAWPVAMVVAALALAHGGFAVALSGSPALLAASFAGLAAVGVVALHGERRPALLALPLGVAAAALAGPVVQLAAHRTATTLALAAWCAAYVAGLLRPASGSTAPTRAAVGLAAAAGTTFLLLDGGVLAPHAPRLFAAVLAAYAAWQVLLARRHGALALAAPAAFFSAGGLAGAAAHVGGSADGVLLALAALWAGVWIAAAAARVARGEAGAVELSAAAGAAATFALVAAILVPPSAPAWRGAAVALPAIAPAALGIALRARRPRGAAALVAAGLALAGAGVLAAAGSAAGTVVWAISATALVVGGFARRSALARRLGLGVFAATLAKLALWDVWRLARSYQILVFVAVGALLLAASYLYARRGARAGPGRGASTHVAG